MKFSELLKPNLAKIFITILLGILVFLIGLFLFKNPVFLKVGCAPNLSCPHCESCLSWGFPGIINFEAVLLAFVPLYLFSCLIYRFYKKSQSLYFFYFFSDLSYPSVSLRTIASLKFEKALKYGIILGLYQCYDSRAELLIF